MKYRAIDELYTKQTIKARVYGSPYRIGKVKEFAIVDELPVSGETVNFGDDAYVWGEIGFAFLDTEQRHSDESEMWKYDFYEAYEVEAESGEYVESHYFAMLKGDCDD